MDNLISISLTAKQWNVLEVALDRFIEDQVDDGSDEAKHTVDVICHLLEGMRDG